MQYNLKPTTPSSACNEIISLFRKVVEKVPSYAEIDALEPHPKSSRKTFLFFRSSYLETQGKPEALWQLFFGSIYDFERDKLAVLSSLKEAGFEKEEIRINNSLEHYGISFGPVCPSKLNEMKIILKDHIKDFKERANREIAVLQALKKEFD